MKTRGAPGGAQAYAEEHSQKKKWLAAMICLAALVVFCTVYALVMPAATLEGDTYCGETEHTHTEACYESTLVCGLEEDGEHTHDAGCYEDVLVCDLAEHTHTDECYVNPEETEGADSETADTAETLSADAETAALPDGARVPDGYTQQYTVRDEENGFAVTVYAPEGVIPEGATLTAALLGEGDEAYATAETALLAETPEALSADGEDESEEPSYGFAALDIHFEDAEGNEVEPDGNVYVVIDAAGLLPEDADPETVTVQHHAESDEGVTVETVADAASETDGVVAVTDETAVQAAFEVDSFSTFTIRWNYNSNTLTVQIIDTNGNSIGSGNLGSTSINSETSISTIVTTIASQAGSTLDGYTFSKAVVANSASNAVGNNATQVQRIQYQNQSGYGGGWRYSGQSSGNSWSNFGSNTLYLIYQVDSTGGGSGGGTTTQEATVTTGKTAYLRDDGNYDLTLSITGTQGSESNPVAMDVLFIVDKSGSMSGNRMSRTKTAMNTLVNSLEGNSNINAQYSIVTFSGNSSTQNKRSASVHLDWTSVSGNNVSNSINSITANGGTNYQAGLDVGNDQLNDARSGAIKVVIFLSDGEPTFAYDAGNGSSALGRSSEGWRNTLTQAGKISCNYFYAISIGDSASNYMTDLVNSVSATTKQSIVAESDGSNLTDLFEDISSSITFFAASNVTISDPLSEYAEMVLDDNSNPQFTITVTRAAYTDSDGTQHQEQTWTTAQPVGNNVTLTFKDAENKDVTVTASYNSSTKTITLNFPDEYELEEGYTYSISTVITPSQAAISAGMNSEAAKQTPDDNTGTHSEKNPKELGFWSNDNDNAKVSFEANGESDSSLFPKPVIQVTKVPTVDITINKVDAQDSNIKLPGAEFYLTKTVDGTTLYYKYDNTSGVTWVVSMDEATKFSSSSEEGDYVAFTITDLEDGTYSLVEVTAPAGYQLPSSGFDFTVTNGAVHYGDVKEGTTITITNTTGQILPETGGAGTTFWTISGLLVMAAAVGGGYVLRRRRGREGN